MLGRADVRSLTVEQRRLGVLGARLPPAPTVEAGGRDMQQE